MGATFLSVEEDVRLSLSSAFTPLTLVNKQNEQLYPKIGSFLSHMSITSRNCTGSSVTATY